MISRRSLLVGGGALAVSRALFAAPNRIIDTHTHFYDPTRPQGVPWPSKGETNALPACVSGRVQTPYSAFGITGTIAVEASPLVEDNQWVLDLAAKEPIIVGTVGHLAPGTPRFSKQLARFHKNRRFRGIRIAEFGPHLSETPYVEDLKLLSQADLELDILGGPLILAQAVRISDIVPDLRIVIEHLPFDPPPNPADRLVYKHALHELGQRPQVYIKVSNVLRRSGNVVPKDLNFYRPSLDELWNIFGADRLVYGSNWPVSTTIAPYEDVFEVVHQYFAAKGQTVMDKFFWRNSKLAYKW
jgi:predicted TIM-barrel fold metal-dependent hydrolase